MTRKASIAWICIAVLLTFVYWMVKLNDPFADEPHAWASAHMALLAHSFSQLGIVHLHGVPIQNNLPLGTQPDKYIHWPPLYAMLLGVAFRILGESEAAVHAFVICGNIFYLAAFYFLVKRCFDREVAAYSLFALLTIPVFVQYGRLAWTPNVAMGAVSTALYCFLRGTETNLNFKWITAGAASVAFGVFFSWEVAPLGFILLCLGLLLRSRIRQIAAAVYAAAGLGSVGIVLVLLVSSSPELQHDLWSTVRFRMGGGYEPADIPIHAWADHMIYVTHLTLKDWFLNMLDVWEPLLGGTLGLLAMIGVVVWSWNNRKNRPNEFFAVGGLIGIVVTWCALFPNHVYIHAYEALIAAPIFSVSLGVALDAANESLKGAFRWVAILIVPLILMVPLARATAGGFTKPQPSPLLDYAKDIENNTPETAVVLSPSPNMLPVYYSHRHIIRSVGNDEALRSVMHQARRVFPGSDVFIAITPESLAQFSCVSSHFPLINRTRNLILFKVTSGACG